MATAKNSAPAAKKAAPAPAAKKAAPTAKAAPAPAPAPAPVEDEAATIDVGTNITFLGYDDTVPAEEQYLTAGEVYTIAGFTEANGDDENAEGYDPGGDPYVMIANPSFNAKARESENNPKEIAIPVYEGEYEVAAEAPAEEVAAPAPAPAAKTAAKKAAPAPAAKTAPAKTAGKKAAPAPAPAPEPEGEAEDPDAMPDLEGEDEEVLALVNGGRDLIEVAQELEATAATSEYRLGGVLFHIKKDKTYLTLDGGEQYAEKGGFSKFLLDYFNIEYRKAMYLIEIYVAFTQAKIENPAEAVARMGWAKASKIAKPMMVEGANPDDLVALAENNTVADLSTAIKEQVEVGRTGGTGGTRVTRTTLKFRLEEQAGATVVQTLEAVMSAQSMKDIGEALVYVINDWAASNVGTAKPAAAPRQGAVGKPVAAKKAAAKA